MLLPVAWDLISVYMYVLLACYNDLVSPPPPRRGRSQKVKTALQNGQWKHEPRLEVHAVRLIGARDRGNQM